MEPFYFQTTERFLQFLVAIALGGAVVFPIGAWRDFIFANNNHPFHAALHAALFNWITINNDLEVFSNSSTILRPRT
jgi:hypothetical protein